MAGKEETIAALKATVAGKRKKLSARDREKIFLAHDGVCHICGITIDPVKETWDADHVIPREITGRDDLEVFKPAHERCHRGKGGKTGDDVRTIRKAQRVRRKHMGAKLKKQQRYRQKMDGSIWCNETGKMIKGPR